MERKVLIAYFSLTGNTRKLAEEIQKVVGGDLFAIEMVEPYPKVYSEVLKASKPDWENKIKPPLKNKVDDFDAYDVIFIGSPNWFGTMTPPVFSFLAEYDFAGKTVIPFMTHGGGGASQGFAETAEAVPNSTTLEGLALSRSHLDDMKKLVNKWLKKLALTEPQV